VRLVALDPAPVLVGAAALVPAPGGSAVDVASATGEPAVRFRRMDRYAALGFAAARLALRDAGLPKAEHGDPEWATLFGSSLACWGSNAEYFRCSGSGEPPDIGPALFARTVCNTVNGEVAIAEQLGGESETLVSGWAAGAEALAEAAAWIAGGRARRVVAGGIEAPSVDLLAMHAAHRLAEAWLPERLEEGAAACVLADAGEGPRVRGYVRCHDPSGDFSLGRALDSVAALRGCDVSHVVVANTVPPPLGARLRAEAEGRTMISLPATTGELGAGGGVLGAIVVRDIVKPGSAGLVIARGIEGGTVALVIAC
jgi:hypothetical protein